MFLATLAALASPTQPEMESAPWTFLANRAHDDAGTVKVFNTKIRESTCFKAEAVVADVPGSALLSVAADPASAPRWSTAGVTKAELLGRAGTRIAYFQYLDIPNWTLASDRYWFLEAEVNDVGPTRWLRWDRMPPTSPHNARHAAFASANPSAVEPPINTGSWQFTDSDFGTQIRYIICTDSGGNIPKAIQNAATKKTLPDTVGDMVREAKRRAAP